MPAEPAVTEQTEQPPKDPTTEKPQRDPELEVIFRDYERLLDDKPKSPPPRLPESLPSVSLGDAIKANEEKRLAEEAIAEATPKEPAADPPKEETPAAPPAPVAETPPKVEVKKKTTDAELQTLIDERIAKSVANIPKAAPAPPPVPPKEEKPAEDEYESKLGENEKDELKFARYAAAKDPNLKDLPTQVLTYFKKIDAYVEKARKDDPSRTFDEVDDEWNKFQRENRPKVSPNLRRKLERDSILEEAKAEADAKVRVELERIEKRQELMEKRPLVERAATEFSTSLDETLEATTEGEESLLAPIAKRAKEIGWDKAAQEDPLFAPIVQRVASTAKKLAGEYLGIANGTIEFNPNSQEHTWLSTFIVKQGKAFKETGGDATIKDGKQFLPREEFFDVARTDPEKASRYWTWTDADVLVRIAANARKNASTMLSAESEKLTKAGFERRKPEPPKKDLPKPENNPPAEAGKSSAPKAPSSVGPGIAGTNKVNGSIGTFAPDELKQYTGISKG